MYQAAIANTVDQASKNVIAAAFVREAIVKAKYFRKCRMERAIIMQALVDSLAAAFGEQSFTIQSSEVLKNLAGIKDPSWAEAIFMFASPSMFATLLARRLECENDATFKQQVIDTTVGQWKSLLAQYANSDANTEILQRIGKTVEGNVALSTAYNEVVGSSFQIPVYDEDAVQASTLPEPPAEIIVDLASLPQTREVEDDTDA